ncbi:enoyl-CoA hydratase/isomerase family protein [Streptomyces sp. A73]|uniref:enoyl-CoA hydratase/isomerase family protein n=1 Tax=Streptomyces TaxID=1883 RepID=UPI000C19FFBE|nr:MULTISPECIES: enoyl-CoA hydratase/isomerase family protein [unclassified Streptomyces]MBQ0867719.1 enoyl-CoA hydratase/isomerase family protein [Streptomyces sp. RK75]MBQ1120445.1 enoyl-CoA hydratase/isomerase family protein [Streptomyces sp. B15]MBQ1159066.1 enoyl-CoA hydratase/isomerase family protein [Streptomyces sp. A73]
MTVRIERQDGVATVTLDRPEKHNALDLADAQALTAVWRGLRTDRSVRAAVVTGAGGRAFCTGIDRAAVAEEGAVPQPHAPFAVEDPLLSIGPKSNDLWIPVVAAVEGMACGGAFYLLSEAEFLIATEESTFFDPHTSYGMVSAYESMAMAQRMPFGEVARMALMGAAERISGRRAYETGLVSELAPEGGALGAALRCARTLASYPPGAVQGTVRAVWAAKETARNQAMAQAPPLIALGNLPPEQQAELFRERGRGRGGYGVTFRTR